MAEKQYNERSFEEITSDLTKISKELLDQVERRVRLGGQRGDFATKVKLAASTVKIMGLVGSLQDELKMVESLSPSHVQLN